LRCVNSEIAQVTSGEEDDIKHLESELKAIAEDIVFCKRKIGLLNEHTERGDKKLFENVNEAYKQQNIVITANRRIVAEYYALISDAITKFTALKKDFDHIYEVDNSQNMVAIYETFNGTINVKGHHAGSDQNAKGRFINGFSFK
jgi:homoserine dehydrogenase